MISLCGAVGPVFGRDARADLLASTTACKAQPRSSALALCIPFTTASKPMTPPVCWSYAGAALRRSTSCKGCAGKGAGADMKFSVAVLPRPALRRPQGARLDSAFRLMVADADPSRRRAWAGVFRPLEPELGEGTNTANTHTCRRPASWTSSGDPAPRSSPPRPVSPVVAPSRSPFVQGTHAQRGPRAQASIHPIRPSVSPSMAGARGDKSIQTHVQRHTHRHTYRRTRTDTHSETHTHIGTQTHIVDVCIYVCRYI